MRPRKATAPAATRRYRSFARLLRELRCARGFPSAAALSKLARLSTNYVSILERGESRPKSDTVRRLADALHLEPADRARLFSEAALAGEPLEVGHAIYERFAHPAVPYLVSWRHLPAALLSIEHAEVALFDLTADDLVADLVRALGSMVAWVRLQAGPPSRHQLARLCSAAHRAFEQSIHLPDGAPHTQPDNRRRAACDAASVLPRAWRAELFGRRAGTARAVLLLRNWAYFPRGYRGPARVGAWLRDQRLNAIYSFEYAPVELVANVHDALAAERLWSLLDLTRELGTQGYSSQEWELTVRLHSDLLLLQAPPAEPKVGGPHPCTTEQCDDFSLAAERTDLALRLYELPRLAARVFRGLSRADIASTLSAAAGVIGGISARFPGAPWPPSSSPSSAS